jgi:hypothetical protein
MGTKKSDKGTTPAALEKPSVDEETRGETEGGTEGEAEKQPKVPRNIDPECRKKLLIIIDEAEAEGRVVKCLLYKPGILGRKGEKGTRKGQWYNYIPEEHDVGLTFGSGFYLEKITVPNEGGTEKVYYNSFTLDPIYDEYKKENDKTTYRPLLKHIAPVADAKPEEIKQNALIPAPQPMSGQLSEVIALIREIAPLFRQESQMEQLGKFGEVMAVSMQKQLLSNIAFFKQLQAEVLPMLAQPRDDDDPDDDPDNGKDNPDVNGTATADPQESVLIAMVKATLPKIMPQLASYALRLLDPDPSKSEAIIKMLNSYGISNIFQTPALSNDAKKIIAYLDTQLTPEKTTAALEKIGVNAGQYR